ncbi:MAG: PQQ-dependent sugar dehydrogenase [Nanoarchaeota archaeon]|nr:PQQ-dependent sugar dehydrogenase [Nanoarchaeota archaeon]
MKGVVFSKKVIYYLAVMAILIIVYLLVNPGGEEQKTQTGLELVAQNLVNPVYLTEAPDGTNRLFVVDRIGLVRVIDSEGVLLEEPFLDLRSNMVELRENFDERGLLGVAFHPDFKDNGKFFVYYSAPLRVAGPNEWDHTSRVSEFIVEGNRVNISSERIILEVDEPSFNHNGGQLAFGNDGYLYISLGDGGGADDVGLGHPALGNGQDTRTLLGSILRIDVNKGVPYSIPMDNPFVGKEGRDEVYAYGLRNPFRMSFDKETGRLFAGDVGQNLLEEINIIEKGKNYGWNIKEGTYCFSIESPSEPPLECPETGKNNEELVGPILEYNHSVGISVIGGFVYRGKEIPEIQGKYVFGDWSNSFTSPKGKIFVAEEKYGKWEVTSSKEINSFLLGFGEDDKNELYVLTSDSVGPTGNTGKVYRIIKN